VFWAKDCVGPQMTQTVGITTAEFAATGGEKLRAIIAARREGVQYIHEHPDEAADIVAKAYNGDAKLYREVIKHFIEIGFWGDGRLNYPGMNRMAEGMLLVGTLKAAPDWAKLVDTSFLPADLASAQ
jgi:NitT/TauT family transport system substrate-binding protein